MQLDTATRILTTWRADFTAHLATQGRSAKTVRAYLSDLDGFAAWYERTNATPFTPDLTTGVDLRLYRQHALDAGKMRPATFNRKRASLAVFCDWLLTTGVLSYNPFQGIDPWDEDDLPPRWLDQREFSKFMRQVELLINGAKSSAAQRQAIRDAAMVSLMAYAGLREFEVVALNIGDVQLTERKGRVIVRLGKGQKERQIPLGREARRALGEWLAVLQSPPVSRGRAKWAGETTNGPDQPEGCLPLFPGDPGARLTTRTVQRRIHEIGRMAGITVTPHDLRHTFAKRLLDAGKPITVVSKLLGHSRLETTARYVTPGWADYENAVESL